MNNNEYQNHDQLNENMWASILSEDEQDPGSNEKSVFPVENSLGHENDWEFLKLTQENNQILQCEVIDFNNRGLLVKHEKFNGFIPISHLADTSIIEKENFEYGLLKSYLKKMISGRIIELDADRNRIVLSERIANIDDEARDRLLSKLKVGTKLSGKIINIKDFGIFVDLGGVEGLVHISEISWQRVNNIKNKFKISQEIKVKIIEIGIDTGKISLSIKRLMPNPWEAVPEKYPKGKNFVAKVIGIAKYGIFVKLDDGLEGLIHISEIKLIEGDKLSDVLAIGEEVLVELISVDVNRQRMSLRLVD